MFKKTGIETLSAFCSAAALVGAGSTIVKGSPFHLTIRDNIRSNRWKLYAIKIVFIKNKLLGLCSRSIPEVQP
ncbi:MAG TPA: hypothetical protein DC049_06620 [Spirochaetia bacterium]|nr:hypothetical protein [Spirochaetia bacterium]